MTGGQVGQPVPALGRGQSLPEPSHMRILSATKTIRSGPTALMPVAGLGN
jgi:hypothetical protein